MICEYLIVENLSGGFSEFPEFPGLSFFFHNSRFKHGLCLEKHFFKFLILKRMKFLFIKSTMELNGWETLLCSLCILTWWLMSVLGQLCSVTQLLICRQLTPPMSSTHTDFVRRESDNKWTATSDVGILWWQISSCF